MKAGIAVMLRLATSMPEPRHDVTWLFYDNEETDAVRNGLGRVSRNNPKWLEADLAILMEPTANRIEAGCQGTLRALVVVPGKRAHSARSWLGDNAIHRAGEVLRRLASYTPRRVVIDGCEYREGLNAVRIEGGVSGNVVPDRCTVIVNYRFAPDRSEDEALAHVQEVLDPFECVPTDSAAAALPRLSEAAAADFVSAVGGEPVAKLGWTDVARFAALGIPAVNFGPGDPNLAHTREEYVEIPRIAECERVLRSYLTGECWDDPSSPTVLRSPHGTWPVTSRPSGTRRRARSTAVRSRCAGGRRSRGARPTSGCSTRAGRRTGCTPTPGGCCASSRSSSRASGCSRSCRAR
jgi:succinyl-diaminopimelate desuccinylase